MSIVDTLAEMLGYKPIATAVQQQPAGDVERGDSFVNTTTNFGTAGDKSTHARPNTSRRVLNDNELDAMYRFNPYAKKGVNWLPDQSCRKGWVVSDDREDNAGESVMSTTDMELDVPAKFADSDRWARLRGAALTVIITDDELPDAFSDLEGDDDGEQDPVEVARLMEKAKRWLRMPLDLSKVRKVLNLVVVDRREYTVLDWDIDWRSPNFRKPLHYRVTPRINGPAINGDIVVHHSRCIHWMGAGRPDGDMDATYSGDSVLEAAYEAIVGKSTVDNAGRIMANEAQLPVLKVAGLPAKGTAFSWEAFYQRMSAIALGKSASNAVVLGADEEYAHHPASLTGWGELDATQKEAVAAALDMPVTEIFGTAPTGMNADDKSGQTRKAEAVLAHQVKTWLPNLRKLYTIIYASSDGPTGGAVPDSWKIEFRPIDAPDAKTQAEIDKLEAEADSIRIADGIYTAEHIALSRFQNGENGILKVNPEDAKNEAARKQAELAESMAAAAKINGEGSQSEADENGEQGINKAQGDPLRPQVTQ